MIQIVYTEEYAQYATTLTILMVAALVGQVGASLNNAITAARRFKTALAISGIAGTAIVPAALWLIPKYGITGGAWSLTIGYGAKAVLCAIMLHSMTNCLIKESMEGQGSDVVSRTA